MNTLTETQVRLFASSKSWIEGEAVRQLYATAKLDGVRHAVGFPVGSAPCTHAREAAALPTITKTREIAVAPSE